MSPMGPFASILACPRHVRSPSVTTEDLDLLNRQGSRRKVFRDCSL